MELLLEILFVAWPIITLTHFIISERKSWSKINTVKREQVEIQRAEEEKVLTYWRNKLAEHKG